MFYFLFFFIFFYHIFGAPRRRIKNYDIISKLVTNNRLKSYKLKKSLKKKQAIATIEKSIDSKNINNTSEKVFSALLGSVCTQEIRYGHIFNYFQFFLNNVLEDNPKVNELVKSELLDDIDIFLKLLHLLIDGNKEFNPDQIKQSILEYDELGYKLYFSEKNVFFLDQQSYGIQINSNVLLKIHNFFEDNNIKDILTKVSEKKKLEEHDERILAYYDFQQELLKNNILIADDNLINNEISLIKKNNISAKKDSNIYLYLLSEKVKNGKLFKKIISTYLYSLILQGDFISLKFFKDSVIKTISNKKDITESFQKINEAFRYSEYLITNLWNIISKNKEVFLNSDEYIYIEKIDGQGGMSEYLKKYILAKKPKNLSAMQTVKNYLPTILKVVGAGIVIAGGVYAAKSILGGAFIEKGIKNIGNFIGGTKDAIVNWFREKKTDEILYKAATTNFLEQGLLSSGGGFVNIIEKQVKSILPGWFSSSFLGSLGILALNQEVNKLISEKVLIPIAKTLGLRGINVNFSFYNYSKNKLFNLFKSNKMSFIYIISGESINESLLIEKIFEYQKNLQSILIIINNENTKYIKRFESLLHDTLKKDFSQRDYMRHIDEIFKSGKEEGMRMLNKQK